MMLALMAASLGNEKTMRNENETNSDGGGLAVVELEFQGFEDNYPSSGMGGAEQQWPGSR
jgi:hypothetical protein